MSELVDDKRWLLDSDSEANKKEEQEKQIAQPTQRLMSLDAFRGITVLVMILVDDADVPEIGHVDWNGIHLADFVMPFFLFIVGAAVPLAFSKYRKNHWSLVGKTSLRVVKLFLLGLFSQGGSFPTPFNSPSGYNLNELRICGILQRIAVSYGVISLLEIFLSPLESETDLEFSRSQYQPSSIVVLSSENTLENADSGMRQVGASLDLYDVGFCHKSVIYVRCYVADSVALIKRFYWFLWAFLVCQALYLGLMFGFQVDNCPSRGMLTKCCNAAYYFDRKILSSEHLYSSFKPIDACPEISDMPASLAFDPEGIVSGINAMCTVILGIHAGHILFLRPSNRDRLVHWSAIGILCLGFGIMIQFIGFPLNKRLWSSSYLFVTGGAAYLGLCLFYITMDIYKWGRYAFYPLMCVGLNAFLVYLLGTGILDCLIQWVYWNSSTTGNIFSATTLISLIEVNCLQSFLPKSMASLVFALVKIVFWMIVAVYLHTIKWYWRI